MNIIAMTGRQSVITDHHQQVITHTTTLHKSRRFNPFGVNPEMYLADSAGTHSTRVEPDVGYRITV